MENYIGFNNSKKNLATTDFEKDFYNLVKKVFYGKAIKIVKNRVKTEIIEKDDIEKIVKQQSKLIFIGFHKSYTKYDSYTVKQNEVLMNEPTYSGCAVLELSKLL